MAYATQSSGADWLTWHVKDVATGRDRGDVLRWSKFSGATWHGDDGFLSPPRRNSRSRASLGGLPVSAVLVERPHLFGAALPDVGGLDMLRFQEFTVGKAWIPEYGASTASVEQFRTRLAYCHITTSRTARWRDTRWLKRRCGAMLSKWTIAVLSTAAAFAIGAGSAHADNHNKLAAELCDAGRKATSFQATMTGFAGMTISMTVVRPDRAKSVSSIGPITSEAVVVGSTAYLRINGGPWQTTTSSGMAEVAKHLVDSVTSGTTYTVLPDRQEDGATVGAFSATLPGAPLPPAVASSAGTQATPGKAPTPTTMTCTYDKSTFLTRTCIMQLANVPTPLTMTYSNWNDPKNTVDVPATAPARSGPSSDPNSPSISKPAATVQ